MIENIQILYHWLWIIIFYCKNYWLFPRRGFPQGKSEY